MTTNEMAASLRSDGFNPDEIANMLGPGVEQQPVQLRWGLDDVQWGDDDSVIVMLSGPDGEPYWLELAPERAAVLRQNLAGPDGEHPNVPAVAPATDQTALRNRIITALNNAHHTHPCPALGDEIWSGCVHYDEAGRVAGVGSCHSGRRADAVLAVLPASVDRASEPLCVCGHPMQQHFEDVCLTNCGCNDGIEAEAADLPDRLAAALTARFTELGNPFSEMRYHEQGPDGWPSSHPVGPKRVAKVLRELMAEPPAGGAQQPKETRP